MIKSQESSDFDYQKKLVSVVIPTYNQVQFVADTLDSVVNQTYRDIEVIIADDCSTDGTIEVLKEYAKRDKRIKLLLAEMNQGIPRNFNKAFDAVRGEFVAFLGGDDLMYPQKIEKLVKVFTENPNAGVVYSDMKVNNTKSGTSILHSSKGIYNQPLAWVLKIDWYLEKDTGILPSACLARSVYYLHARYDERFYLKHEIWFTLQDYYYNPKMKWVYLDEVLGEYHVHGGNFSKTKKAGSAIVKETFLVSDLCLEHYPESRSRVEEHLRSFVFGNLIYLKEDFTLYPRFYAIYKTFNYRQKLHLLLTRAFIGTKLFSVYRILAKLVHLV